MVQSHALNIFYIVAVLVCSWEKPWVVRERATHDSHFSQLWIDQNFIFQNNPNVCSENASNMQEFCLRYAFDIQEIFQRYAQDIRYFIL